MSSFGGSKLRTLADIERFEQEMPFEQRLSARSVFDLFAASAQAHPERFALTQLLTGEDDEQPRRLTYRELLPLLRRAANLFASLGGPRPGVAYMLPSLIDTHLVLWGAETAGFAVPVNYLLQPQHIAALVHASGASILVALGPHAQLDIWPKALAVKALLPQLKLVCIAAAEGGGDAALDFHQALMQQPDDRLLFGEPGRDDEVAAWFHTGGTTGVPKLAAHSHRNQIVAAFGGSLLLNMKESNVGLSGFPLFHVAGAMSNGLSLFMSGAEVVILSPTGFRNPAMVKNYWKLVQRYRATRIGGVPTVLGALCDVALDGADLSSVLLGACGAASTPLAVAQRFEEHTGYPLHEVLGMTETAGITCIDPAGGTRVLGSVGFRLPYTRVSIRRVLPDGSPGEECAANEIGVMTVAGPTVSRGYRNEEQNQGVFVDGVLNTGDLAYAQADGRIFMAGRAKDLIIRSGHNIDPLMIEGTLSQHPDVAMAAAVSQPDAYAGELPVCYVALRQGAQATEEDLQRYAQQHIAERPAWPKRIYVVPSIPMTGVGKIFKPQLRADATARLVRQALQDSTGLGDAGVHAEPGGKRGMTVTVTLPASRAELAPAIEKALAGYLFELRLVLQ